MNELFEIDVVIRVEVKHRMEALADNARELAVLLINAQAKGSELPRWFIQ